MLLTLIFIVVTNMLLCKHNIPSHCEIAVVLERAIMLVFEPITLPFRYRTWEQNADDFWVEHCADCALRSTVCRVSGALSNGNCLLSHRPDGKSIVKTVQMPVPRHTLFFAVLDESPKFAYERPDGSLCAMRMSNIYGDGSWCSGGVDYDYRDPTSIYSGYFNSIHNNDLSPSNYESYIAGLVDGTRTMDYDSMTINPEERWGAVQNIVTKPSVIEWFNNLEENAHRIRGTGYVKIS
jgi:hypothetical protein